MTPSSCEETPSDIEVSGDENRSPNRKFFSSSLNSFRGVANMLGSHSFTCERLSPLPELDWVEQKELWHSMVLKDMVYVRDSRMLQRHPDLEPRMRAILLDWLTEEIYPPKLEQFSYVTDGACNDSQILAQELILIMTLNWNLSPISVIGWLSIFLQLAHLEDGENLIGPEKCPKQLVLEITRVLDLCILDTDSLKYPYSVLAASAIAHFISKETAMHVSGISWGELLPCVTWMKPFVEVACDNGPVQMIHFNDIAVEYRHNIQTHSASLRLLDRVHERQQTTVNEFSPSTVLRELTPPHSHKKKKLIILD
ncbi:hypothetical protein TNIN_324911 [Trichonephila inaurata madagascariensis]|uniref:Cyclin C-terminal domain-containing protein n=1 Tax=Trichonephila inaurata madagascariensis TaxID=2747483 RepID=A0A8X7CA12_9ARAC|nr:hypothetical protein TNIN_324911 [Trichonephila inaurata madagascariensis]